MACEKSPARSPRQRAHTLCERGLIKPAIDILEVELNLNPEQGELWLLRGKLLHRSRQYSTALKNLEQALMLVPLGVSGHLLLADCYRRVGRDWLAAETYIEIANHYQDLRDENLHQLLIGLAKTGQWKKSAQVCRLSLRKQSEDDRLFFCLAQSLLKLDQPAETVLPLLRRAVNLAPSTSRYRAVLVLQLLRHKRADEAYAELLQVQTEEFDSGYCRDSLYRLLQLAVEKGDAIRAKAFALHLAETTRLVGLTEEHLL